MEPFTLAAVGAIALTEGIKFLYGQAGELLKGWRARKGAAEAGATAAVEDEPIRVELPPAAFQGSLQPVVVRYDALSRLEKDIKDLSKELAPYAGGFEDVDPADRGLLDRVDAMRLSLEAVLGQRLTFVGESRPTSGSPVVVGEAVIKEIEGRVAGVRARMLAGGNVSGTVRADIVRPGGEAYGVDADVIGSP